MIRRIVKMSFKPEMVEAFIENFDRNKNQIRAFEGCEHLELWQDRNNQHVFFTYSIWLSEDALNNYRSSDFFMAVWKTTKNMFVDKAEAWSLDSLMSID